MAALPPAADVGQRIFGWVVLRDGAPIVKAIAEVAHAGFAGDGKGAGSQVKALLAQAAGIDPHLVELVDLKRPVAVAMVDPALLGGIGRPVMALLPITDRGAVERALATAGVATARTPWGLAISTTDGSKLFVAFRAGYALAAWRPDLLAAASQLLEPQITAKVEAPLVAHVALENLYHAYGTQLEQAVARFAHATEEKSDPQLSFALRGALRLSRFADSFAGLDLLLDSDDNGVTVTARVDGKKNGAWATYVAGQTPGPAWGAKLIPRDAVLVYMTRRSQASTQEELDSQVAYLGDATTPPASEALRTAWRSELGRAASEMAGEIIYAVWPGSDGGVGLGGAYRVRSATEARKNLIGAYRRIGDHLTGVAARALKLDPAHFKLHAKLAVRSLAPRDGAKIAVDTVELSVRWPSGSARQKKLFERLFGSELVLATAFVDDAALFAVGRDWKTRLGAMVGAARGQTLPSLADDPVFGKALADRAATRVSLTYLPIAEMAGFVGRLLRDGHTLEQWQIDAMKPVLLAAGNGAIVSATHAGGVRYEMATHLPASALPGLSQIGAVMWRIALSPLLNPPAMPPLPIPPAHVTPQLKATPRTSETESGKTTL
jgi:hypothetical protein